MMCKIIYKYWKVFQINPEWRITFQNNSFVAFKKTETCKKLLVMRSKTEKCLKSIQKTEKENANVVTHHYVACTSLKLVHYEVTKHSNYTLYFTSSRM